MILFETLTYWSKFIALSAIPIFLWLYFLRNHIPQKKSYVVLTFVAGMISVVPIKLYEHYWNNTLLQFKHLNIFRYLSEILNIDSLDSLTSYIMMTVLVLCGIFFFVAFLMFLLEIFTKDNSVKVFEQKMFKIFESPLFFISIGIILGIVAFFSSLSLHEKVWFFMMVGILEEFTKHLVLRFSDEEKVKSVSDAMQYAIIVALGFAFIENIMYFETMSKLTSLSIREWVMLMVLRSIFSVGAHILFSAILGYFYGVSKFSEKIYAHDLLEYKHVFIQYAHKILHMKGAVLFHEQKMMEGVILAMLAHGIFNSLLEFNLMQLVIPYLLILALLVWFTLFHQEKLVRQGVLRRF